MPRKTHEQFVQEMSHFNPHISILSPYETAHSEIKAQCTICGNEWITTPNKLLNGAQCQSCIKPHTSFMEQFMLAAFQKILGKNAVCSRDTEAIGMELDIYLPEYKLALEPGTWLYHKKKANATDQLKRNKGAQLGIRVITIYDTYPRDIPPPFSSDCYVFTGFLNEPGFSRIISLISTIMTEIGVSSDTIDWVSIANEAYASCHYNAHENFKNQLSKISPDIAILEEYKGTKIPISVNKITCAHPAWKARPETLLKGISCPLCGRLEAARSKTRSHTEFETIINKLHPSLKLLSSYSHATERINVIFSMCQHTWAPKASSLLSGKGCPHCSAVSAAKKRKNHLAAKSPTQFVNELSTINPNITVLTDYTNNKTKVSVSCTICNHHWDVVPASLLNGHGCPKCAKRKRVTTEPCNPPSNQV